jgi:hypothetical protein
VSLEVGVVAPFDTGVEQFLVTGHCRSVMVRFSDRCLVQSREPGCCIALNVADISMSR